MMRYFIFNLCFFLSAITAAFDFANLQQQLSKNTSIQGEFEQLRYLQQLPQALTTRGYFVLIRDKGLLWKIQEPFPLNLRLNKSGIYQQDEQGKWQLSTQKNQTQQIELFLALLSGDSHLLSAQFTPHLSGDEKNWQLSLIPKDHFLQQIFIEIRIKGDAFIQEIEILEKQGDRSLIRFSQQQANIPLSPEASQALDLP